MECVLLGTAQDAGVPQIFCHCSNCTLVKQGTLDVQFPSCLAIVDTVGFRFWMVDATPDFKSQIMYMDRSFPGYQLAGIFITHLHMGHYTGLLQLGQLSACSQSSDSVKNPVSGSDYNCLMQGRRPLIAPCCQFTLLSRSSTS